MKKPELTFACELETDKLIALFENDTVIRQLVDLKARISLGLLDLSKDRANMVQKLNWPGYPGHCLVIASKRRVLVQF